MEDAIRDWPPHRWAWAMAQGKGRGHRHPRQEDLERFAAMRHMRGGPGFGGPFGGGRGRKRRGDVRVALLLLLAEEPRNGYQLMQTIEERSGGLWRVSPGSVYPTLAQLEDEGYVRSIEREDAKLFEITEAGREHLEHRGDVAPPWEQGGDRPARDLRGSIAQIAQATMLVARSGTEEQVARATEILKDARKALYLILAEDEEPDA